MFRALGRSRDEELGRGDDLVARGVVLPDPRLVIAELVKPLDELEIAPQCGGGILVDGMEGREKDPETQARGRHRISCPWGDRRGRVNGVQRFAKATVEAKTSCAP